MRKLLSPLMLLLLLASVMAFTIQLGNATPAIDLRRDMNAPVISQDDNSTDDGSDDGSDDDVDDSDHDGVDDDKEKAYERELEVEYDTAKLKVDSTLKNGTTKDSFEVQFELESSSEAEISFKFKNEVETSTSENETELSYKVKFDEIIEFVDTGALGYQNETVITQYKIGNSGWEDLDVNFNDTIGFLEVNATTSDGVFTILMTLTSTFLQKDNVTIAPNSLKIDVLINDFPLAQTDSKLAIETKVKSEAELSIEQESEDELEGIAKNETEVEVSAGNATGFFSWADFAIVDGNTVDVITSSLADSSADEGEKSSKIFFTFDAVNPKNIFWDPKLGVISVASKNNLAPPQVDNPGTSLDPTSDATTPKSEPPASGNSPLPISWAVLFFAFFAVPIIYKRRIRN